MSQHFLFPSRQDPEPRSGVPMSDAEAETAFCIRWPETNGAPVCPRCGGVDAYDCRRPNGSPRFRCRACHKDFSITSGTLFASHKLPLRAYLAAIAIFCNEVKGKSALALSRDLNVSYKCAFVLAHKLREAMADGNERPRARRRRQGCGSGRRLFRRLSQAGQSCREPCRSPLGRTKLASARPSSSSASETATPYRRCSAQKARRFHFINSRIAKGTIVNADESASWDALHAHYEMKRINHQEAYSIDGACTNMAEEYFSRLRRAEAGHHHHIAGIYLFAMLKKRAGGKITAAWRMAIRLSRSPASRCIRKRRRILWDIGRDMRFNFLTKCFDANKM